MTITYTEKYTTMDRSTWGRGPWDRELYDKLVWKDANTGLDCMMKRNQAGAWCGYVAVPKGHHLFGVDYSDLMWATTVHGGLTYSDECSGGICHLSEDGDHVWWIGFDCNHGCDTAPASDPWMSIFNGRDVKNLDDYCDQNYVTKEVQSLAEQLRNITEEDLKDILSDDEDSEF